MEERIAPVEVRASSECGVGSEENGHVDIPDVSMPVCFLVKEQAKSLVAIQDLQKRVENLEAIQEDVIDSLAEIRKFLCNDSRTYSGTESSLNNASTSPSIVKSGSFSKSGFSPVLPKYLSPKEGATSKNFDSSKNNKESSAALESDKQDSGLDSDCREVHDPLSLHNPPVVKWVKSESSDELLQLLDEITLRTEVLQQKHALDEESGTLGFPQDKHQEATSHSAAAGGYMEQAVAKGHADISGHLERKSLLSNQKPQKRVAANKIDSAMVSSILKETNTVDLQRQVLIYLVENAVLQTKLSETERLLSSKEAESVKLENSLKDEARLLMMENRELRIGLDEQKLETNALRSKVLMLERVLQSVSVENRELAWQLGESFGVQNFTSHKDPPRSKFSSTYATYGNPNNTSKFSRRCSLPTQFSEANVVNCAKSKLLSNASSFLDVTAEEEPEQRWSEVQTPAFEHRLGPVQSSTPLMKLKDVKSGSPVAAGVSNFQSVKKRFRTTESDISTFKSRSSESRPNEPQNAPPEACAKSVKFHPSDFDDAAGKFPFNTILEKLKANSDHRISKRTSLTHETVFSGDRGKLSSSATKVTLPVSEEEESDANLRQSNNQSKNFQARKGGKNIHQRIQNILDRIMSEEAT